MAKRGLIWEAIPDHGVCLRRFDKQQKYNSWVFSYDIDYFWSRSNFYV